MVELDRVAVFKTPQVIFSHSAGMAPSIVTTWSLALNELASKNTSSCILGGQSTPSTKVVPPAPPEAVAQLVTSLQSPVPPTQYKLRGVAGGGIIISQPVVLPVPTLSVTEIAGTGVTPATKAGEFIIFKNDSNTGSVGCVVKFIVNPTMLKRTNTPQSSGVLGPKISNVSILS